MRFWISAGDSENWKLAIKHGGIWGVREPKKSLWEKLGIGDIIGFYVTYPISGIVGFGIITKKFEERKPLWPDEVAENKVIWPFRFRFEIKYILDEKDWKRQKIPVMQIGRLGGLTPVKNRDAIISLLQNADVIWNTNLISMYAPEASKIKEPKQEKSLHETIKDLLFDIVVFEGWISEKEYKLNGERLDVVWIRKGVEGARPKVVFEVQLKGSPKSALANLKDAYDKRNSIPVLVVDKEIVSKVEELLQGTFHEILYEIKIVTPEEIRKMHQLEKELTDIKRNRTLSSVF